MPLSPPAVTTLRPPPGFRSYPLDQLVPGEDFEKRFSPLDKTALQQIFQIDNEDWFELKTVTKDERLKMSRVMRIFAKSHSPDQHREFQQEGDADRNQDIKHWMQIAHRDNKPATATRKLFEKAAKRPPGRQCLEGS